MRGLTKIDRFSTDQAEPWELPFTQHEGGKFFSDQRVSHPWSPSRESDVPGGALESLHAACGIDGLHQVFIIPFTVRSTGIRNRKVMTPLSVLAIGSRAVGLWTEKPREGVVRVIRLEELDMLEDVTVLLYGRLSFMSAGSCLTVRYNTVSRTPLEPALLELRERLAGAEQAVPGDDNVDALPFKWNRLVRSSLARLCEEAPAVFRFASVSPRSRREAPLGQLLVLNPYELVYMRDPPDTGVRYGVDAFIIPRSRLGEPAGHATDAKIRGQRPMSLLPMPPQLREAASRWFPVQKA